MRLFHIVELGVWRAAVESGRYHPASLDAEGFVHCSFVDQVAGTANLLFGGVDGLVVIELDGDLLDAPVVVEDSYGAGTLYPHVYGPIPTVAAVAVHPLPRDRDDIFSFDPGAGHPDRR